MLKGMASYQAREDGREATSRRLDRQFSEDGRTFWEKWRIKMMPWGPVVAERGYVSSLRPGETAPKRGLTITIPSNQPTELVLKTVAWEYRDHELSVGRRQVSRLPREWKRDLEVYRLRQEAKLKNEKLKNQEIMDLLKEAEVRPKYTPFRNEADVTEAFKRASYWIEDRGYRDYLVGSEPA